MLLSTPGSTSHPFSPFPPLPPFVSCPRMLCPAPARCSQQEFAQQDPIQVLTRPCEMGASLVLIASTLHVQTRFQIQKAKHSPVKWLLWSHTQAIAKLGFSPQIFFSISVRLFFFSNLTLRFKSPNPTEANLVKIIEICIIVSLSY